MPIQVNPYYNRGNLNKGRLCPLLRRNVPADQSIGAFFRSFHSSIAFKPSKRKSGENNAVVAPVKYRYSDI